MINNIEKKSHPNATLISYLIHSTNKKINGAFHRESNFDQAVGIWFALTVQPLMEIIP